MASKSKRKEKRNKRRRKPAKSGFNIDPHVEVAAGATGAMLEAMLEYVDAEDLVAEVTAALTSTVAGVTEAVESIEPARIIEAARLAALPWGPAGTFGVDPESAPPRAEIIALLALAAASSANKTGGTAGGPSPSAPTSGGAQPVTDLVNGRLLDEVDQILRLAQIRQMAEADPKQPLTYVAALMRGSEIWIRNSSYPEMLERTVLELFADTAVQSALRADLGFDAQEAIVVLRACHALQVDKLNARMTVMRDTAEAAMKSKSSSGKPHTKAHATAKAAWTSAWEGDAEAVAVSVEELATSTGLPADVASSVLEYFTVDLATATPQEVVDEYTSGNNPLRTHPVVAARGDQFMLVHDTHILGAVRENLEQHLKSTAAWNRYAKLRGELLETRTREALDRILPTAVYNDGLEYFVPANDAEEGQTSSTYTKKVEGDHLVLIDDVALIIEDKAVAVTPTARAGESARLRRDLTGIVTKAAEQSGRLRDRIVADKGIQVHGSGWLDLSHIREIHTIAVSLDDLTSVSTATAELVKAGILTADNIPWTVSIHDLDLITQLIDHPAEFLLYLRRRRNAQTSVMFTAPDELDLFLHFYSRGLWAVPDPDALRAASPFLGPVTTSERREFDRQMPAYITSHTDALDLWYYSKLAADNAITDGHLEDAPSVPPRPAFASTPLKPLVDELRNRGTYGWLSTSATMLAGSEVAHAKFARIPIDLLNNPFGDGRKRSHTVPITAPTLDENWLLVWMTLPAGHNTAAFEKGARDYLRAKKHQVRSPRGVVFVYSETTKSLVDVYFDDHTGALDPDLAELAKTLRPPEAFSGWVHPDGKRRPGTKKSNNSRKRKRQKK